MLKIGDKVNVKMFDGGTDRMIVYRVEARFDKNQMVYIYRVVRANYIKPEPYYNKAIAGIAFRGTVLEVKLNHAKVHLEIDETQDIETAHWFPVAVGNNAWHVMPHVGEQVKVRIMNVHDAGFVYSGIRGTTGAITRNKYMTDPNNKVFQTKWNQAMALQKNRIQFDMPGTNVTLDENSIYVHSNDSIRIEAENEINIGKTETEVMVGGVPTIVANETNKITIQAEQLLSLRATNLFNIIELTENVEIHSLLKTKLESTAKKSSLEQLSSEGQKVAALDYIPKGPGYIQRTPAEVEAMRAAEASASAQPVIPEQPKTTLNPEQIYAAIGASKGAKMAARISQAQTIDNIMGRQAAQINAGVIPETTGAAARERRTFAEWYVDTANNLIPALMGRWAHEDHRVNDWQGRVIQALLHPDPQRIAATGARMADREFPEGVPTPGQNMEFLYFNTSTTPKATVSKSGLKVTLVGAEVHGARLTWATTQYWEVTTSFGVVDANINYKPLTRRYGAGAGGSVVRIIRLENRRRHDEGLYVIVGAQLDWLRATVCSNGGFKYFKFYPSIDVSLRNAEGEIVEAEIIGKLITDEFLSTTIS